MSSVNLDHLLQFYSWRGNPPTLEWIYKEYTIEPGEDWNTLVSFDYFDQILPNTLKEEVEKRNKHP